MKDLPHHIKKLNRRIIRSIHREMMEEEGFEQPLIPPRKQTLRQQKLQTKRKTAKERKSRVPSDPTLEQRNRKMKKRVPIFGRTNKAKPRVTKATKKKTPRI